MRDKKRCRIHGGANNGAPKGNKNAFKHGARSAEALALNAAVRSYIKEAELAIKEI